MLGYMTYVVLCYITCVMLCYITCDMLGYSRCVMLYNICPFMLNDMNRTEHVI